MFNGLQCLAAHPKNRRGGQRYGASTRSGRLQIFSQFLAAADPLAGDENLRCRLDTLRLFVCLDLLTAGQEVLVDPITGIFKHFPGK